MNIEKMMAQAQVMQAKMEELQETLGEVKVEGMSESGEVRVRVTCKGEVRRVFLREDAINPENREALEAAITTAMNDAKEKADKKLAEATKLMMADLGLPEGGS